MEREVIATPKAPAAVGPYEQGIKVGQLLFTAGQIPKDPASGQMVTGDIQAQTRQVLENLKAVLEAGGSSLEKAVKVNVYLKDLRDFAAMNQVFERYFSEKKPARTTVQVADLPLGVGIEADIIALCDEETLNP